MIEQPNDPAARIAELERTIEGNWRQIGKQGQEILNLHAREEEDRIRMEGAEARIAAALAVFHDPNESPTGDMAWAMYRALTGE